MAQMLTLACLKTYLDHTHDFDMMIDNDLEHTFSMIHYATAALGN